MQKVTAETLNNAVDFDAPFRVSEGGFISREDGLYAPEMFLNEEFSEQGDKWELISGFSGQDSYAGPIMHSSEYLGGAMAQYVLDNPGVYVLMAAQWEDEETPYSETDGYYTEGWILARYKEA